MKHKNWHFLIFILFFSITCSTHAEEIEVEDPWEPFNRKVFVFNDYTDRYLMEPVAKGYDWVIPGLVQRSVGNFFENIEYPSRLLSNLIRFNFGGVLNETGRFLVNSSVGVGGLFDVASEIGLEEEDIDFGLTLALYGMSPGPYIVLPFLGPSNLRDALGRTVDTLAHPFTILLFTDVRSGIVDPVTLGGRALEVVNTRSELIDAVETGKGAALDYYVTVRTAYAQHRNGRIRELRDEPVEKDSSLPEDEWDF